MKLYQKITLSVVVALASTGAMAAKDCDVIKDVAHNTIYNRQHTDMNKEEALEVNRVSRDLNIMYVEDGDSDKSLRDILEEYDISNEIVKVVYDLPIYEKGFKDLAVATFEKSVYKNCKSGYYDSY